ncbi:MAG: hypothetical protein KDD12_08035, partial [Lewinella sp.]|nr:hypothetical protein [Lewinella sp.]
FSKLRMLKIRLTQNSEQSLDEQQKQTTTNHNKPQQTTTKPPSPRLRRAEQTKISHNKQNHKTVVSGDEARSRLCNERPTIQP